MPYLEIVHRSLYRLYVVYHYEYTVDCHAKHYEYTVTATCVLALYRRSWARLWSPRRSALLAATAQPSLKFELTAILVDFIWPGHSPFIPPRGIHFPD